MSRDEESRPALDLQCPAQGGGEGIYSLKIVDPDSDSDPDADPENEPETPNVEYRTAEVRMAKFECRNEHGV